MSEYLPMHMPEYAVRLSFRKIVISVASAFVDMHCYPNRGAKNILYKKYIAHVCRDGVKVFRFQCHIHLY